MTERTIGQLVARSLDGILWRDQKIYVDSPVPTSNPDIYMGIELEIEGWQWSAGTVPGFSVHNDNSLRNNGLEWITYPTKLRHMEHLLSTFFKKFPVTQDNYSERCSTHVHVNVQDFTPTQLTTLVLVYQLVERLLFRFVGNDRDSNIFCVPWYQAGNTYELVERLKNFDANHIHQWQKYTALNLLTVEQKGTVEYRHLEGTGDVKRIMIWCNLLGSMHAYAKATPLETVKDTIVNLNTSSAYDAFLQTVFGEWAVHLMPPHYIVQMEDGVLDCKYMLSKPSESAPKAPGIAPMTEAQLREAVQALRTGRVARPTATAAAPRRATTNNPAQGWRALDDLQPARFNDPVRFVQNPAGEF